MCTLRSSARSSAYRLLLRGVTLALVIAPLTPLPGQADPIRVEAQVQIKDIKFNPATLNIDVGTTVIWTNLDSTSHDVAITDGPETWLSQELRQGQAAGHTFTKPGKYHYFCEFHPNMQGDVIVGGNTST